MKGVFHYGFKGFEIVVPLARQFSCSFDFIRKVRFCIQTRCKHIKVK